MSKELNKAPVEQAGGDEREAAIAKFAETCPMTAESAAGGNSYDIELRRYYLLGWDDRTALAQPSPAQAEGFTHFPELLESVQQMDAMLKAEVERPEVVGSAWRNIYNNGFDHVAPFPPAPGGPVVDEPLMTVAQHAASVARWAEMFNRVEQERDAALARVAEWRAGIARAIERASVFDDGSDGADAESARSVVAILSELLAQAQHSVPVTHEFKRALGLVVAALEADGDRPTSKYALSKLKKVLAAAPGKEVGHE
ncbi:hypothetical protein QOT55_05505 [Pseudomonas aeruginosa]|nr:hypothetical protein [Pseudomonas aeruginosa]